MRTVYLNGEYLPEQEAKVSIFDRGFLFADAVYEVTAVLNGKLLENAGHLARLARSCRELQLTLPASPADIEAIQRRLIELNQLREGAIYLQLSRGATGDREFDFPPEGTRPTLMLFTQSRPVIDNAKARDGIRVVTVEDIRWRRRDIKTVGLLASCLAKDYAHGHGADDAFLVADGLITEGSASNAWIVNRQGTLVTRPLSRDILHGITRQSLLELIRRHDIAFEERPFSVEEAYGAREAFISSATSFVWPVVQIDGRAVGTGQPGPVARKLRQIYVEMALQATA
ncbi:D-amino-acid transaminase [Martelella alba]|uniref:Probable branched-chain-amino-acid aminotransferase n=1 Tax=Martelella alba TaxID=2590451 RepID=A0ABY2SI41_9HYPH|nr:D-amino-acid transaminase [Martelella alba]TKI04853.1 D-amino-acid transaminase [Martelella alba]